MEWLEWKFCVARYYYFGELHIKDEDRKYATILLKPSRKALYTKDPCNKSKNVCLVLGLLFLSYVFDLSESELVVMQSEFVNEKGSWQGVFALAFHAASLIFKPAQNLGDLLSSNLVKA